MSPDNQDLERLCAKCGVEIEYFDLWGQRRRAPESTKIRLQQAMGVAIHDARGAAAALAEIENGAWRNVLPPVKVVREGEAPPRIVVTLPATRSADAFNWFLKLESGERSAGTLRAEALIALDSREIAGVTYAQRSFDLPAVPAPGYHSFSLVEPGSGTLIATMRLIVCPALCFQPQSLADGARIWGPAIQLYALRSARNWGVGDLADLRNLVDFAASARAGIVGMNPLHALFPDRPTEASPYRPSNRTHLNVLYLDVESIADFEECPAARRRASTPEFQTRLAALRAAEFVDYAGAGAVKFEVLELLYRHFRSRHLAEMTRRGREFRDFQAAGGEPLRLHALFEALQEKFFGEDPSVWGWPAWPAEYRDPASEAVSDFSREHVERVEYFEYLQWQVDAQLGAAARR